MKEPSVEKKRKSRKRVFRTALVAVFDDYNMEALSSFSTEELDRPNDWGRAALFYAAKDGRDDVVLWLLERGCNPGQMDSNRNSPFLEGIQKLRLETLKAMHATGKVDVMLANSWGWNSLHRASEKGDSEKVEWLLSLGMPVDLPVGSGKVTARTLLLSSLGRAAERFIGSSPENDLEFKAVMTESLFKALRSKDMKLLITALEGGADVEGESKYSGSPLDSAVYYQWTEAVPVLKSHGASLDRVLPKTKRAVIHSACRNRDASMLKALLDSDADPNVKDEKGLSPLHYLVRPRLVQSGNYGYSESSDPSHAVSLKNENFVDCARLLLAKGALVTEKSGKTGKGVSPIGAAKKLKVDGEAIASWLEAEALKARSVAAVPSMVRRNSCV